MPNPIENFSPMSDDQWSELLELLRLGLESGMELIWIDWSCGESRYTLSHSQRSHPSIVFTSPSIYWRFND